MSPTDATSERRYNHMNPNLAKQTSDNSFVIVMLEGQTIQIMQEGEEMINFVNPYEDAELWCYIKRKRVPIQYK